VAWFKRRKDLAPRLLAVWLIVFGVNSLVGWFLPLTTTLLGILGIAVGVLILLDR